jgi:Acyl-CoA dehydrogenase N terminal
MAEALLNPRGLEFILYELLDTESLLKRPRYQDHSRETFTEVLNTARYYMDWELPQMSYQAQLLRTGNSVCFDMQPEWY